MTVPLVVLAAGLSTRYGRLKQLDELGPGGETIMDYNVYDAVRAGFDEIVVVTRPAIEDQLRAHCEAIVGSAAPLRFVHQTLDDVPEGFRAPPDRSRPWGTGHAVLCGAKDIDGPFGICNADDHYGPGAFAQLYEHMALDPAPTDAALVGYTLEETLSGSGGVARGVCVLRDEGLLYRVFEVREIRNVDGWTSGVTLEGQPMELSADQIVSMNLWGFTRPVVEHLGRQFRRFLETWGSDWRQEFLLSTALSGQIQIHATEVAVLRAEDHWFGITHAADRDRALEELRASIERGEYPERLSDGFQSLT